MDGLTRRAEIAGNAETSDHTSVQVCANELHRLPEKANGVPVLARSHRL